MTPRACFRISAPKITSQTIDGEVVIINLDSGYYYSLDKAGACVWNALESGDPLGSIIDRVASSFEGERAVIEDAVIKLIDELQREELIAPDETQAPAGLCEAGAGSGAAVAGKVKFEAPVLQKYTDMQDLLLLDPIHEVDETGWPRTKEDV